METGGAWPGLRSASRSQAHRMPCVRVPGIKDRWQILVRHESYILTGIFSNVFEK